MKNVRRFFVLSVFFALAACSSDAPQVPTALSASSVNNITAAAGTLTTTVPTVTLTDAGGKGIAKVWVHFSATGGGKPVNDSNQTNASGLATSGGWTLGTVAGVQTLTATASGLNPVIFNAQVTAGAVSALVRLTADPQAGVVNTNVPSAPSVRAVDQYGNPVAGVTVSFSPINAAGTIAGNTKTTDANGVATADSWTLGTVAGQQLSRATALGVSVPATFSANAVAGSPTKIVIVTGNNVAGVVGASLASFGSLPAVKVTDQFDNPVAGVSVTFTPGPNSGTVTGGTAITNDGGVATLASWTLGTVAAQTLTAALTANSAVKVTFSVSALLTQFNITLRYIGDPPSARQQLAVSRAVDKWRSVIVSNSGTSTVALPAASCGRSWFPAISESVTNVLILAQIGPIDGVGNVLGNGGYCTTHAASGLTSVGTILFDSADLATYEASGLIDAIVLHEMGHVLGFGTQWGNKGVTSGIGGSDPIFTGANAIAEFAALNSGYSGRPVPIENCIGINQPCGGGTRDVHWRELIFKSELMTGYLNNGVNPLSRATVASMADLGYAVSYAGADPYTLVASLLFRAPTATPQVNMGNDVFDTDIYSFDRQGNRKLVRKKGSN
ncbi:MAG: Ig-like domain-containing protein [Gemmatimonadaceae bacterium]